MLGTQILDSSLIERRYTKACEVTKLIWGMGKEHRKKYCDRYEMRYLHKERTQLKKCVELSKQFRIVTLDKTVERRIKTRTGEVIICPLVFSADLPLKGVTTLQVTGKNGKTYEVKANTPLPTKESLEAIRAHKHRFDSLALWWVPNEIVVEEVKELDPILVGKIATRMYGSVGFELHRWIDENTEAEYWAKEAY
jgi:hypothetical protein